MDKNENPIIVNSKQITKEILSPDKSKELILSYVQDINPRITFNYRVLDVKTNKEIYKGTFIGLKLEWYDNSSLKGYLYQGMETNDEDKKSSKNYNIIKIEN
jgi:hypothetical protein